eukprot:scaffold24401_cov115-Isochrysis_galbana.AAC.5
MSSVLAAISISRAGLLSGYCTLKSFVRNSSQSRTRVESVLKRLRSGPMHEMSHCNSCSILPLCHGGGGAKSMGVFRSSSSNGSLRKRERTAGSSDSALL